MYHVLVPMDADEDRAMTQARYVASLPEASESVEATVLFVFGSGDDVPQEWEKFKSASRIGSVRHATEYLEEHDVEVELLDESGDTAEFILKEAEERGVDAIVLGGRKRSPAGKALFGSVTQSVILNTDLPVVVTGGRRE
jgi:nucleotide-binding universal stress UspA family protein